MCDGSQRTVKDPTPVQSFYMGGHSNLAEALILARTPKLLHTVHCSINRLCTGGSQSLVMVRVCERMSCEESKVIFLHLQIFPIDLDVM